MRKQRAHLTWYCYRQKGSLLCWCVPRGRVRVSFDVRSEKKKNVSTVCVPDALCDFFIRKQRASWGSERKREIRTKSLLHSIFNLALWSSAAARGRFVQRYDRVDNSALLLRWIGHFSTFSRRLRVPMRRFSAFDLPPASSSFGKSLTFLHLFILFLFTFEPRWFFLSRVRAFGLRLCHNSWWFDWDLFSLSPTLPLFFLFFF